MVLALRHGAAAADPARRRAVAAGRLVRRARSSCSPRPGRGRRPAGRAAPASPRSASAAPTPTSSWRRRRPAERATAPSRRDPAAGAAVACSPARTAGRCAAAGRPAASRTCDAAAARPRRSRLSRWPPPGRRSTHRAVVLGRDRHELLAGLAAVAAGQPAPNVVTGTARRRRPGRLRLPRPGRAVGRHGRRAAGLLAGVRRAVRGVRSGAARRTSTGRCVDVVRGGPSAPWLERVDVVQPALWAVMVSLAAALARVGRRPRRGGRPLAGRDRRRLRRRRALPRGRRRGSSPCAAGR